VDYEFRIKVAEKELAHLHEMQKLFAAHQDTHDTSITALGGRMDRVEANLEATSELLRETATKLAELIQALRGGERNGHAG
jgi:hypothetical protein